MHMSPRDTIALTIKLSSVALIVRLNDCWSYGEERKKEYTVIVCVAVSGTGRDLCRDMHSFPLIYGKLS